MNPPIVRAALLAIICCVGLNGCVLAVLGAAGAGTFLAANSSDFQGDGRPRPAPTQAPPPAYAPAPADQQQGYQPAYRPPTEPDAPPAAAPSGGPIQSEPLN